MGRTSSLVFVVSVLLSALPSCAVPAASPTPASAVASPPPPPLLPPGAVVEAPAPPPDARTARLARMVRIWAAVRFYDPAMLTNGVDWDSAFVAALPAVEVATDASSEAAAIGAMLSVLRDPATRVVGPPPAALPASEAGEAVTMGPSEVLLVTVSVNDEAGVRTLQTKVERELPRAKAIVVDLRQAPYNWGTWVGSRLLDRLAPKLVARELNVPSSRLLQRSGYEPDDGSWTASGQPVSFLVNPPTAIAPESRSPSPPRLAIIVGRGSELPSIASLLQREAGAVLVAEGKLTDAVPPMNSSMPLAGGYVALVRDEETPALEPARADAEVVRAEGSKMDAALEAALRLLKRPAARRPLAATSASEVAPRPKPAASEAGSYPDRAHRVLALARAWSTLDHFWPHKRLLPRDAWSQAFAESLPAFEAARDEREYVLALAAFGARTGDSHVDLLGVPAERLLDRRAIPTISVLRIEGQPAVARVSDAARAAGVVAGDVLVSVDGEPFEARVARLKPYVAASTPWDHAYRTDLLAQGGAPGSTANFVLRDASGRLKEVRIVREERLDVWPSAAPKYRVLDGNVGYVDLLRLTRAESDAMLDALWSTRAMVFDLRGLPLFMMLGLAARLNQKQAEIGAFYLRPHGSGVTPTSDRGESLTVMRIPPTEKPIYAGPVALLVDERTFSLGEADAQILRAAGARLVGSTTAGVDGDMTRVCVPGGLCMLFSGADVRLPDGSALQRVGLRPDVEARPTLRGLREGRDEVLERALRLLREGR
jgi:C-terminal processing protease CtpA/Prc